MVSLTFPLEEAIKRAEGEVRAKHWRSFSATQVKLVYVPLYLFNFTAYVKMKENVMEEISGQMAMDATTGDLNEMVSFLLREQPIELRKDIEHKVKHEVLDPAVEKDEVKEVAKVKLASKLKIPEENVKVFGIQLIYYPFWWIWAQTEGGTFKVEVDGVAGMTKAQIPERKRNAWEIVEETLEELKDPKNWVKYFQLLLSTVRDVVTRKEKTGSKRWWAVVLLLLALIIAIILLGGVKGPKGP